MKIVYIVQRIGPYHHARFNQVSKDINDDDAKFHVIEVCNNDSEYEWEAINSGEMYERKVLFNKNYEAIKNWEFAKSIFHALNNIGPDVVFIPGWSAIEARLSLLWCHLRQVKRVLLSDSSEFDFQRNVIKELVKKAIVSQFHAAFVAGTPHSNYVNSLGMPKNVILTGYDVVDNNYFNNQGSKSYQYKGYILASGRFLDRKNFELLIEAYAIYRNVVKDPKNLVLCGSGVLAKKIKDTVSKLNLEEFVLFPGFLQYKELPQYYSNASVFIIPSTSEQWGLVINEAMASGLPILSSKKCGAHFDLVKEGGNGFTFSPLIKEDISDKLVMFHELDKDTKRSFSKKSLDIISHWTTQKFSNNLQTLARLVS